MASWADLGTINQARGLIPQAALMPWARAWWVLGPMFTCLRAFSRETCRKAALAFLSSRLGRGYENRDLRRTGPCFQVPPKGPIYQGSVPLTAEASGGHPGARVGSLPTAASKAGPVSHEGGAGGRAPGGR